MAWQYEDWTYTDKKTIILMPTVEHQFFERRGVLVVSKSDVSMSNEAKEYIRG